MPEGAPADGTRTLLLLRHCRPEDAAGGRDLDRRLDGTGHRQAREIGDHLRASGHSIGRVLCSPATRTRETLADLDLPADTDVDVVERLYNAGGDTVVEAIRELPEAVHVVLIIGHAPGLPAAVYDLADPATSSPSAVRAVESRFPAGTLAELRVTGSWSDLADVALVAVRLP
jgi:phosphohistidine phosphatase